MYHKRNHESSLDRILLDALISASFVTTTELYLKRTVLGNKCTPNAIRAKLFINVFQKKKKNLNLKENSNIKFKKKRVYEV